MDFLRQQAQASSYLNVLQSMVDTVVSRNGKRRPMPIIAADDAEYSEKLYARRASRVLRRKMAQPAVERMLPMWMRDSVVRGDGFIEAFADGGDVGIEKFPRSELVFDDGEARGGMPRTLARVKLVDRDVLAARYPKHAKRIRKIQPASRDIWSPYDYDSPIDADFVEVGVGWRLPTSATAKDGATATVIRDGGEPLDECPWERPRFPVARIQWTPSMRGFYGIGLIQQLAGSQNKVNDLWGDHQEALYWGSGLKLFVPRSANINEHHLKKRHPIEIETDGPIPQYIAPNPASTQAMDSLRWLIQQMYEISGISQAAAQSKNPLGPNASGRALDSMNDLESDRFSQFELQYSMGRVDVGMIMLDTAKVMAEDDYELPEGIELAPWITSIEWERFNFDGGTYHLNIEPTNFLPDSRSGKLDALGDMGKIPGLLGDPLQTASLFEEPDIQRANRHLLGPIRMLEKVMEMLGDSRIPLLDCVPTRYMKPDLAKSMCEGELGNAFSEGANDDEIGRYRWFLLMLDELNAMATPAPAGPPMPDPNAMSPGAPPPGVPGPMGPPGPPGFPDPMAGGTAQLAAGMPMPLPPGVS